MTLKDLEDIYHLVSRDSSTDEEQAEFANMLLQSNEPEVIRFHYELLRNRRNESLFQWIQNAFVKRGAVGEKFLISAIDQETAPEMLANDLHILGRMRSQHAREYAIRFMANEHPEVRHVASYVLGWVGQPEDVDALAKLLLEDPDPETRSDAATAFRQMFRRMPTISERATDVLGEALDKEADPEVLASILITLQTINGKKFGMREDIDEGTISGDVETAKRKALKFLSTRKKI